MLITLSTSENQGGEPKAPLFRLPDTTLVLAASVYAGGGFGEKFVTQASFLVVLLLILVTSKRWMIPILATILVTSLIQPALIQSPPLLAAIFLCSKRPATAVLVLLGSAVQLIGGFNPYYLPLVLLPAAVFSLWKPKAVERPAFKGIATAMLLINLFPAFLITKSPEAHQGFAFPYRVDIAKMPGVLPPGNTYSSIDDHGDIAGSEIQVLEHDPGHGLAQFNWSQQRLWTQNQYYGSALLRIATELDGFLYSNLGCRVDNPDIRWLGEAHRSEYNSLIGKKGGKLVFSDSDFLTNGAIGYQKQLANAMFHRFSFAHFILFGTSIGFLLALWPRTRTVAMILLATVSISACIGLHNQVIDIRIVDDNAPWPHAKGIGGIGAEVDADRGIMTVARAGRARILGIGRDCSATHRDEKVIVMEGGSTVKIGSITFHALDLPLGNTDGITDAIPVRELGSNEPGKCIQKSGKIVLIGTNSARENWKAIYDASK